MTTLEHRIPPPIVGLLVAAGMWAVATLGPLLPISDTFRLAVVAILAATGLSFDLLGFLAFHASRTTINPLKPERASTLVTGGVYRITRNPMYVGLAVLLTAWAVYLAAVVPLLGPVLFVLYITRFQIRPEERILAGLFGDEYSRYAARVRRWL